MSKAVDSHCRLIDRKGGIMRLYTVVVFSLATVLAFPALSAAQSPALKLDLGNLQSRAKEVVNINLDKNTVEWAGQAMNSKAGNDENLRNLMKELNGITVQVLEFEKGKAPAWEELMGAAKNALRELDSPQWQSIISVTGNKEEGSEIVRVSLFKDTAGQVGGMAVLVVQPAELVLVNISGKVRLDQLESIGKAIGQPGMFGLKGGKPSPQPKEQGK
jgi:hypothetical protein